MKRRYKIRYHPSYDKFILKIIFSGEIFHEDYKDFYYADKNKIDKIYKSLADKKQLFSNEKSDSKNTNE